MIFRCTLENSTSRNWYISAVNGQPGTKADQDFYYASSLDFYEVIPPEIWRAANRDFGQPPKVVFVISRADELLPDTFLPGHHRRDAWLTLFSGLPATWGR